MVRYYMTGPPSDAEYNQGAEDVDYSLGRLWKGSVSQ